MDADEDLVHYLDLLAPLDTPAWAFNPLRHLLKLFCKQRRHKSGSSCTLFANGNIIRYDPILVDLTSSFFNLCTNVKVYLHNYS